MFVCGSVPEGFSVLGPDLVMGVRSALLFSAKKIEKTKQVWYTVRKAAACAGSVLWKRYNKKGIGEVADI